MASKKPQRLRPDVLEVELTVGPVKIAGSWVPSDPERLASWDLYIELITRISVIELPEDEGILRESLTSLHTLFNKTRDILHKYGPDILHTSDSDEMSFGYIAIVVLNYGLRPLLTKWHPLLQDWEDRRAATVSRVEHERNWKHNKELRDALNNMRAILIEYATILSKVADVPDIHKQNIPTSNTIPETRLRDEAINYFVPPDNE